MSPFVETVETRVNKKHLLSRRQRRRGLQDASPFVETEETRVKKKRLLSLRQRRRGLTRSVSFRRDNGDAGYKTRLLSLRQRRHVFLSRVNFILLRRRVIEVFRDAVMTRLLCPVQRRRAFYASPM